MTVFLIYHHKRIQTQEMFVIAEILMHKDPSKRQRARQINVYLITIITINSMSISSHQTCSHIVCALTRFNGAIEKSSQTHCALSDF